jgi:hypothetical protein
LRTVAKIEAAIDNEATHLADGYVVPSTFTIGGQTTTPAQTNNVKYNKPSHKLMQFGFVASWQNFVMSLERNIPD